MRKFYKTVITVTVLSDEDTSGMSLDDIMTESDTGGMVAVSEFECEEILKQDCAQLLIEFGSEPEFFGIGTEDDEDDEEEK